MIKNCIRYTEVRGYILVLLLLFEKGNQFVFTQPPTVYTFYWKSFTFWFGFMQWLGLSWYIDIVYGCVWDRWLCLCVLHSVMLYVYAIGSDT
jgi:hypothetical protein